jgi:tetratricopeptide (TPR) repeat protein
VELDTQNADAMNNLAYTYSEMGTNLDQAASLCQQAATLRPSRQAYYLDTLGNIYLKQGKLPAAIATFDSALAATTERQASLRAGIEQRLATARALLAQQPLTEK